MYFIQVLLQTSSQYWNDVIQNALGGTIGSILAIAISFLIYWLTIRQSNAATAKANEESESNQLRAFTIMLKDSIKVTEKQSEAVSKFVEEIKKQPNEFPLLSMYSMGSLKRVINTITIEGTGATYMKYFPSKDSAKEFTGILGIVDYLFAETEGLTGLIQRASINHYDRKLEVSRTFDRYNKFVLDYIYRMDEADIIGQKIRQIKKDFDANRGPVDNIDSIKLLFFLPLNTYLGEMLNKGIKTDYMLELFYGTSRGIEYFENITSGYKRFEGEISGIESEVNKNLEKLKSTASKILNSKYAKVE
jgi:hypothetical protein